MTSSEPVPVGKIAPPLARQLAEATAIELGACIRPLAVRRIDTTTGHRTIIPIPCGARRADKCPPCAERARQLRISQAREGWHVDTEPQITTAEPTAEQHALIGYRADLEHAHTAATLAGDHDQATEIEDAIHDANAMLRGAGVRGSADTKTGKRRKVRSTRRRQDAANLPRRRIAPTTTGRVYEAPDGRAYRPSTFLTLTLPSYGPVRSDGSPVDPEAYDYRRAARDAIHFGLLVDRFWQNLRRAEGWNVQYFATVEPQKRGAPHLHAAIRGTIPRRHLRQVAAATYHQVWWPPHDQRVCRLDRLPVWDDTRAFPFYVDRATSEPLPSWDQACADLAEPTHVVRFGTQVNIQGVLGGSREAGSALRYLVKYLTKSISDCHHPATDTAAEHVQRLTETLRYEPCSSRCPNWLHYGVAPEGGKAATAPGLCKGKAHRPEHLGYAGRRCLVSRRWSGKTLTDHHTDRQDHVLRTLGAVGTTPERLTPKDQADRYQWQPVKPSDPDHPDRLELLLRAIAERRRWRTQYQQARDQAEHPATDDQGAA